MSVYCDWVTAICTSVWQHVKLSRSVPEMHSHVAGTLSNQQTQQNLTASRAVSNTHARVAKIAIVCKSRAARRALSTCNTWGAQHVQHVMCRGASRTASCIQFFSTSFRCGSANKSLQELGKASTGFLVQLPVPSHVRVNDLSGSRKLRQESKSADVSLTHLQTTCLLVGCLLNVPATCECISGTDLLRQFYVLPHWERSCRSTDQTFYLTRVTAY